MAYTGQPVPSTTYQQARAKVSDGKSVRVTVPENTAIEAGDLVLLEGFLGFAMRDVKTGAGETAEVVLNIEQAEFETDKTTADEEIKVGDVVYWNPTTGKVTLSADDGDTEAPTAYRPVGRVTSAVDANGVIWFVLGPQV